MPPSENPNRPDQKVCCLCGFEGVRAWAEGDDDAPLIQISCNRCADYLVFEETAKHLSMIRKREGGIDHRFPELVGRLHLISGHTRELRLMGGGPVHLSEDGALAIVRVAPEHVVDRLDRFLLNLARMSPHMGRELEIRAAWDQPLGYCRDLEELVALVVHLSEAGAVRCDRRSFAVAKEGKVSLTPHGWQRARTMLRRPPMEARSLAFVALGPASSEREAWENGIRPAVEAAGYAPYLPDPGPEGCRLGVEAAARIRESRFLVADGTGQDPWVHAAAGFARGLDLPVIWTCFEEDTRQLRIDLPPGDLIAWADASGLCEPLRLRILALIGRGEWEGPKEAGAEGSA